MENFANGDEVTKKDLLDLEERLIKKLVSKEEFDRKVAELATKEELSNVRTELFEKMEKLATREAVDVLANQVLKNTNDIVIIKSDIKGIKKEVSQLREDMNDKFDTVLNAVDKVSRQL